MGRVRPFKIDDSAAVADIHWRVFQHKRAPSPDSLRDYFQTLYLSQLPSELPIGSLVYEDDQGAVRGFVGGIPLRLRYRQKRIWALVAGNHMVDPDLRAPFAGAVLLRRLFAGPQDLTYSDTSNSVSVRMWKSLGAEVFLANSIQWIRILQPLRFALAISRRRVLGRVCSPFLFPLASIPDFVDRRRLSRSLDKKNAQLDQRELDVETMLSGLEQLVDDRALVPAYDSESLNWRLSLAGDKQDCGSLIKTGVYEKGRLLGWYILYAQQREIAEVLQIVANSKTIDRVLNHLFKSALQEKCVAVMGSMDPMLFGGYTQNKCSTYIHASVAIAHSRDPEIIRDMHQGSTFLSRLEGEWWTRLQGDDFF